MKNDWKILGVVCALVVGIYAYTAPLGRLESLVSNPTGTCYNLLVQGFRDGHLSVKKEVPTGFAGLADPYDPGANRRYRGMPYGLSNLSYYKGRLYLYFGVTPALILFWPFVALTGHYLSNRPVVMIFCVVGFLASVGLLRALWRRYFSEVSIWVVAACVLALGLATGVPVLLPSSDMYQVAISCGYMLAMLALGAVWCALHERERRYWWLMAASAAYGLAVGARPSLLFGAIILLVPVGQAWQERRPIWAALTAATVPITLIGSGLMLYNVLRFDSPFEFGQRYQLGGERQVMLQFFNWRYLWFNFLVNFLEPVRWNARFPFVREAAVPPLPSGYFGVQDPFGVLTNIPLAWRGRSGQEGGALRWFVTAACLLFGMCALTLGLYCSAAGRYEVDFLPALVLLAVVGILGLERALAPTSESELANDPVRRRLVRWGWSVLLGFSVVFNVLVSVANCAHTACGLATLLAVKGRVPEAIQIFENVLRVEPDDADGQCGLGFAMLQVGHVREAIGYLERAVRLKPDFTEAHFNLGVALAQTGNIQEAMAHYKQALRSDPDYAEAHNNLGEIFMQEGKVSDAIGHYERALQTKPDYAEAQANLGTALAAQGRVQEAITHYGEAIRLKPDFAGAYYNRGFILEQAGRLHEAVADYEEALRIKPDYTRAHFRFGGALEKLGRVPEAIQQYQQALKLRPDFAAARNALTRLGAGQ